MSDFTGGPGKTRTCDLRFRKPLLYPAELRDQSLRLLCFCSLTRDTDGRCPKPHGRRRFYGRRLAYSSPEGCVEAHRWSRRRRRRLASRCARDPSARALYACGIMNAPTAMPASTASTNSTSSTSFIEILLLPARSSCRARAFRPVSLMRRWKSAREGLLSNADSRSALTKPPRTKRCSSSAVQPPRTTAGTVEPSLALASSSRACR